MTQEESFRVQVLEKMSALVMAAFGLVAALAWNAAIQQVLFQVVGSGSQVLVWLFVYAGGVTILAVLVAVWVGRAVARARRVAA